MTDPSPEQDEPVRWWTPAALLILGPLLGMALGAVTNFANGAISYTYYESVMGWGTHVRSRAVLQGVLEGAVLGGVFGLGVCVSVAASTRVRCPVGIALRHLVGAICVALGFWGAGGFAGVAVAVVSPEWFQSVVALAPYNAAGIRRFAWVGGSIWGAYVGTAVALAWAAVSLHRAWRRRLHRQAAAFPVEPIIPLASLR